MSTGVNMAVHAVTAAAFFFVLQHYFLGETVGVSLAWAVFGACGAVGLAYAQSRRL
jgi:hypothetical protein